VCSAAPSFSTLAMIPILLIFIPTPTHKMTCP
jgi:hypothetical protein